MKVLVFLYKKRLDEKLGESNFESTEEFCQHIVKCIHQAAKEALGGKILETKLNQNINGMKKLGNW